MLHYCSRPVAVFFPAHQDIDTWYYQTFKNNRGDTKKQWLLIQMFEVFLIFLFLFQPCPLAASRQCSRWLPVHGLQVHPILDPSSAPGLQRPRWGWTRFLARRPLGKRCGHWRVWHPLKVTLNLFLKTQRKSKWTTHTIVAKHQSLTDQASIALIHCQPHGGSDNSLADSWDDDAAANVKVERWDSRDADAQIWMTTRHIDASCQWQISGTVSCPSRIDSNVVEQYGNWFEISVWKCAGVCPLLALDGFWDDR